MAAGREPNDHADLPHPGFDPAVEGTAGAVSTRAGAGGPPGRGRRGSDRVARTAAGTSLVLALTLGISTAIAGGATDRAAAAELSRFGDCDAFTAHMRELAEPEVGPYGFGGGGIAYKNGGPIPAAPTDARAGGTPTSPVGNGPTGTNVQERGVDEADLVKIDGDRVLALAGNRLTVTDASSDEPDLKGSLAFPEGHYASELLVLKDSRALVIGTGYQEIERPKDVAPALPDVAPGGAPQSKQAPGFAPHPGPQGTPTVVLTLVDTSRSARPTVLRTETITGSYVSARLHDGAARLVLTSGPRIAFPAPVEGQPEATATARNKAAVQKAEAADWLPARQVRNAAGRVIEDGPLMGCTDVRHPRERSGLGIISVLTLDSTRGGEMFIDGAATGVVGNGQLVYSSLDRLYVATTDGGWGGPRPVDARAAGRDEQQTRIHTFDVTSRSGSPYVGSGAVPGYLYDRWAMSEYDGHLRVATTTGPPWATEDGQQSQSSVLVLEEVSERLRVIGRVDGLGLTERIRAVRWFDDLAAIVTFRQTDPLYLVDLSDPTEPAARGELKIPGYSAYLHPIGGDQLFGVGQNADAEGRVTELQVSAFDVSEITRPTRTDALGFGRGYTQVEHDSRAFTYLPDRRLAVLPASVTEKVYCPPNAQCTAAGGRPVEDGDGRGFVGEIQVPAVLGVAVGRDGKLHRQGRFVAGSQVIRVLPVGDRLAAVTQDSIVLLDPSGLAELGSTRIVPEQGSAPPVRPAG